MLVRMKHLLALGLILSTGLSGVSYAADPREMMRAHKSYFSSVDEEQQSRRRAPELQRLENSKLALLEQKNAVLGLVARNKPAAPGGSSGQSADPTPGPSEPDIPYAEYDDVRDLPPVVAPDPDEISGSYGQAILQSAYTILDPAHPVSKMVQTVAGSIFYNAAMQAIQKVRNDAEQGSDPSQTLASGRNLIKEAPLSASAIRALSDAAKAGSLQPGGFFDPLLREVAILAMYVYYANAPQSLADYEKEKALYWPGYGGVMTFSTYVGWKASQAWNNDTRISSAVSTATQDLNFTPLLDLFSDYASLSGASSGVASAVQMGREALSIYAHAREEYALTQSDYDFQAQMSHYGARLADLADKITSISNKIQADGVWRELSQGGGTAKVDVLGGSADYRDGQGNSVAIGPAAPPKLDFSLGRALSDVVQGALQHIRPWTQKIKNADGSSTYRQTDNNRADYAGLSKSYPDLVVRKIVEQGSDTVWQFVNKNTEELVMEVVTPESRTLEVNQRPLGSEDLIRVSERYELGRLISVYVQNITTGDAHHILQETPAAALRYNAQTGKVVDGVITNNPLRSDAGFAITMRAGIIQEVYIGDASLYGAWDQIAGALGVTNGSDAEADRTISALEDDFKKTPSSLEVQDFRDLRDFVQRLLGGTGLRGQFSDTDISQTIRDQKGVVVSKVRSQGGDYYSDPDSGSEGKYNRGVINFSPSAISDGAKIGALLEGGYGKDIKLLQGNLFGITELGLFGSFAGVLKDLVAKASAKAGTYMRSVRSDLNFKTQVSIDADSDGKKWVAMKFTTVGTDGRFTTHDVKLLIPKNEEESKRSQESGATDLLGKLIDGLYAGRGATAMTLGQMSLITNLMVQKVQEMNAQLLMVADQATRKTVERFNEVFTPAVLGEVFHVFLRSIPTMARKITVKGAHTTALRALPTDHVLTALPIRFGKGAFDMLHQPYFI